MGELMKEFIEFIVKQLVDSPDKVVIEENTPDEHTVEINIKVDKDDIGKVIGKHGNNINALRILLTAVGAKGRRRTILQVVEWPRLIAFFLLKILDLNSRFYLLIII